jgi:hypothetical protein
MARRVLPLLAAALAVAALALAGCGDDEDEGTTAQATEATTDATADTTTTVTETGGVTTTGGEQDGAPPPADIEVDESATFATPTGNIECFIDKVSVRCDIAERDWKPPAAPADCDLDYGQGVILSAGSTASLVCAGDTVLGSGGQELAYGQSISAGLLRCESAEGGVTCRDVETGRGFELSRESYEIF